MLSTGRASGRCNSVPRETTQADPRPDTRTTGVCPRRPRVRATGGCSACPPGPFEVKPASPPACQGRRHWYTDFVLTRKILAIRARPALSRQPVTVNQIQTLTFQAPVTKSWGPTASRLAQHRRRTRRSASYTLFWNPTG